jgi:alpha-N-arabinofuranosidase
VIVPIHADAQGMFRQTIFWQLLLYRRLAGWRSLRPSVRGEGYRATYAFREWAIDKEIPYLDVAAAIAPDERTLALGVVNRHADAAIEAELQLAGLQPKAECLAEVVDGPDVGSYNSMEQPDVVGITRHAWTADAQQPRYRFSPHSLTVLTLLLG